MLNLDDFWARIDDQLDKLKHAKTATDVLSICPPSTMAGGEGFFAGGGGDVLPNEPLRDAGWTYVWIEAPYFWCMRAPDGDLITYIEGDLYRGDQR